MTDRLKLKKNSAARRSHRVRTTIKNTANRPRLSITISNTHVSAQIVDDSKHTTVASASTIGQKIEGNMTAKAVWVGEQVAKNAKSAKVKQVVFDRGDRKYHGRLKALAEAARKEGLEF